MIKSDKELVYIQLIVLQRAKINPNSSVENGC